MPNGKPNAEKRVSKVVIPVAGVGAGLLPVTKSQPKEMLPVGRKPVVQYVVEEALAAGLAKVLFVTGRQKESIEEHFDRDTILEQRLRDAGRTDVLDEISFAQAAAQFFFVRQSRPTGLADAVAEAEEFVGDAPFLVSLGDSIIASDSPGRLIDRMIQCYQQNSASCVLALEEVPAEEVHHYGVAQLEQEGNRWSRVRDLVEKPEPGAEPSRLTLAGRYLFTPEIFASIRATPQISRTGSRELTDAVRVLIGRGASVYAVKLDAGERRYDIGDFASYFRAFFDFALEDERYGYTLWQHLIRRGVEPDPLLQVPDGPRPGSKPAFKLPKKAQEA